MLLFLCCHPALAPAAQIALTLRAVGGLTTAEIARAFLVSEATMTRRITRAKQTVRDSGARFSMPGDAAYRERLGVVLHVLYLIFNEGYATTAGENLQRSDLTAEAIRLTRMVHRSLPDDDEVTGLLALMLLTDARRPARTDEHGDLVPMDEQDRSRWNADVHPRGRRPAHRRGGPPQPGSLPDPGGHRRPARRGPDGRATDWAQIRALYEALLRVSDNPVVALNHVVAVAMAEGAAAGRARLTRARRRPADRREPAVPRRLGPPAGDGRGRRGRPRRVRRGRPAAAPASRSSATFTAGPPGWRGMRRRLGRSRRVASEQCRVTGPQP